MTKHNNLQPGLVKLSRKGQCGLLVKQISAREQEQSPAACKHHSVIEAVYDI